jgi:predicted dehydrogenase
MEQQILHQALVTECGLYITSETTRLWRLLGGLGSHDLSAMREALGMPEHVIGASLGNPFWTVLFQYPTFSLVYESGIDHIPRFDAHIEVYSMTKSIRVQWDTPFVRGLPVTMVVSESQDGGYSETMTRRTYEDPYTLELKALYGMVANGEAVKTTATDAKNELRIFRMIMEAGSSKI